MVAKNVSENYLRIHVGMWDLSIRAGIASLEDKAMSL